jgi:hypothetical protein
MILYEMLDLCRLIVALVIDLFPPRAESTSGYVDRNGNRKAKQARKVMSGSLSYKMTSYRNVMRLLLAIVANSAATDA